MRVTCLRAKEFPTRPHPFSLFGMIILTPKTGRLLRLVLL